MKKQDAPIRLSGALALAGVPAFSLLCGCNVILAVVGSTLVVSAVGAVLAAVGAATSLLMVHSQMERVGPEP